MDLCRQCENWTPDPWAICADCRKEGFVNSREPKEKTPRAIEYDTFDGRRVRAEFRTKPIGHFYLTDCSTGKLLASPIKSSLEWESFVWNITTDPETNSKVVA